MAELFVTMPLSSVGPDGEVDLGVLGFLQAPGEDNNSTAERCYRAHSRSSVLQGLPFGGVPTVLAINVVMWMVCTAHTHTHTHTHTRISTHTHTHTCMHTHTHTHSYPFVP